MSLEKAACACLKGRALHIMAHVVTRVSTGNAAWSRITVKARTRTDPTDEDAQDREGHVGLRVAMNEPKLSYDLQDVARGDVREPRLKAASQ